MPIIHPTIYTAAYVCDCGWQSPAFDRAAQAFHDYRTNHLPECGQ